MFLPCEFAAVLAGRTFLYWFGARPTLCIADVNVVKQVLSDRNGLFPKNTGNPNVARLLGKGLVLIDGDDWKRHRKVVHPAFNMDKLKVCTYRVHVLSTRCSSTRTLIDVFFATTKKRYV